MPAPMWRWTTPMLERRFSSETCAQVGRVAVRFNISAVATTGDYSGRTSQSDVTPVLLPSQPKGYWLATGQDEIHLHFGFHFHRLAIENIGAVSPLPHGV